MNPTLRRAAAALARLWLQVGGNRPVPKFTGEVRPLRAELFSADQMEMHGKTLAGSHRLGTLRASRQLLARLDENEEVLLETCRRLTEAVKAGRRISPAGEWLLDNFYLIEEQVRTARKHLPKGYSRELPRLAHGPSAGLPRVYDIALEAISHGDGRMDPEGLSRFVGAYQKVAPLKLGELWAIPIMLRLALIENLRRVGARVATSTEDRNRADDWADQMVEVAAKDPKSLILIVADMARSNPPMASPFVAELARRLQGQSAALALPLTWIEQRLSEAGLTIEQLVQSETQKQASAQVSISNSIGSLRILGSMDWREFVETMSVVEHKLREDPGGVYGRMDFATRDRYRHAIERIAKQSGLVEGEVARKAIQLAHAGAQAGAGMDRAAHVGYYLVDKGLMQLEEATGARLRAGEAIGRACLRFPMVPYLGSIAALTLLVSQQMVALADDGSHEAWMLALLAIPAVLGASRLALALVNWAATMLATPRLLPRMDFSAGIPADCRTLVVVPAMLTSERHSEALIEALEVRFLANRDPHLQFGLLTDFCDASSATLPEDDALLAGARAGIERLNLKYAVDAPNTFFLFHRPRLWNPQEEVWMGYERKRGKLADLNALLRGGAQDRFSLIVGETASLSAIKYVITLDTDTQLPRDAAHKFTGAIAHPLNRPHFDPARGLVTEGYGILQPRVAMSLPVATRSRYAQLFGSEPGIDPYTRAVSDVYQDVFGEGSFIGKGIYDVDAFEQSLKGKFPENRILSHDLLEGCYARSALLSDAPLFEEYPATYSADVSRRHRWIRGDWQIASWILPSVPWNTGRTAAGQARNPLSALSQWKIFDNLRRSLVPAALVALLLAGWSLLASAWAWTFVVIGIVLAPAAIGATVGLCRKPEDLQAGAHFAASMRTILDQLGEAVFNLACLPHEAYFSLDAIVRTNWRVMVTHKHRLEWKSSGSLERNHHNSLTAYGLSMWFAPTLSIASAVWLAEFRPDALAAAVPFLLLWFVSPAIAWWVSRPIRRHVPRLTSAQREFLQDTARRTWSFFETFVGAQDHWLPPDNFQEHPVSVVAHRTSPTNMGLSLLANLSAYDFGYLSAGRLIERTANTLGTMQALDRHRGHFYNWYDTLTLQPLPPLYVSAVDSGNLAGHLLTLRPGLLALPDEKILGARTFDGLGDTSRILAQAAANAPPPARALIERLGTDVESAYDSKPATLAAAHAWLARLEASAVQIAASLGAAQDPALHGSAHRWAQALARQCRDALDELALFAPWIGHLPARGRLAGFLDSTEIPTLRELSAGRPAWLAAARDCVGPDPTPQERDALGELGRLGADAGAQATERIRVLEHLAQQAASLAAMEYEFLYDRKRHLLAIGYNVTEHRQDAGYYDLLASEARLSSFVAIAQGQLPQESWFALGRLLATAGGEAILVSWSGSMFEYLMPLLVMPSYEDTLLDRTCRAAVQRQIAYGRLRGVAWGVSECGYNAVDAALNYQYRAFGVPGLGLKRGLAEDLVIAPYASALALMVAPEEACLNLQRLAAEGLAGEYGFYEAVDYTAARLPRGKSSVVIQSFMAHHQGMTFLSLASLLLESPMQKRFTSDPAFQATALLLQERVPRAGAIPLHTAEFSAVGSAAGEPELAVRVFDSPDTPIPAVQLLSNGRYHVMLTNAGGGYSRWKDLAVTRWREDPTRDNWGAFCYLRDAASGEFWSNTHQPTLRRAESCQAVFSEGRAEFRRRDLDYDTHTEIVVSPEDDIELRRIHITNRARTRRTIEVTSYAEVVLTSSAADALHPAFANLFVQTETVPERRAILCTRRPRSAGEEAPWMLHLLVVRGAKAGKASYETDRMRFIGRGGDLTAPQAITGAVPLSGTAGSVLDPIVAIRRRVTLEPEQMATIDIVTGIGTSRDAALAMVAKYQDRNLADRVFELAWTHSQVVLRQINASEADAQLYVRLAGSVIYANSRLRADKDVLVRNRRGQSGLWGYAISGDLPIVLLQIGDAANIDLVRQLVQAHAYWRLKGLSVDLVIWNEDRAGYRQLLQEQITGLIAAGVEAHVMDRPGGIFVRPADQISEEDRVLVQSVARAILSDRRGGLAEQMTARDFTERRTVRPAAPEQRGLVERRARQLLESATMPSPLVQRAPPPHHALLFDNGLGGFSADGREYVITTAPGHVTPAPWANVLANPEFGSVISESGMAYTWSGNAHQFRLTPWGNDPVGDSGGEAFYLRDDESGHFWSPTPLPCRGATAYVSRHGFGYSVFEHTEDGIESEFTVYVALDASIKFSVLKLRNASNRVRRLSATGYVEWVLGDLRQKTAMHVVTEIDSPTGALFARNAYNTEFAAHRAFFDVNDASRTYSANRTSFVGRNGTLGSPAAMGQSSLSNTTGAGLDPCAALQVAFELADGEERDFVFMLGAGRNLEEARELLKRFRGPTAASRALENVRDYWQRTLGSVQVETPDRSLNLLANGWLVYQTLACRLWARSGYYQSGGAFGFRDQLQDVMALIHAEPGLMREHLLRAAAHQFREGDAQHWWHPVSDRGVRTHCSDDFLWLPLAICRYVAGTGDHAVLDAPVPFLEGRAVNAEEDSYYDLPGRSEESASLYQHGVRAIVRGLSFGERGLPLMGSGDWNDGMNLVGLHGKGESVWLAFFLYDVLVQFEKLARLRNDLPFANRCQGEAAQLRQNIELSGWDGEWYRRAYFDDGTPLGSAGNAECQIDAIAQSWAVLSGAGDPGRSRSAMAAVDRRLVRREDGLVQLLAPPFDKSDLDPGYIKGYVPGVRENGGQYTHAAIWTAMAFAALGDSARAWELFGMINPVNHGSSAAAIATYKVEPYVIAADVYAVAPHTGRGGWTWYTGSAGWMYRLILESLLGLRLEPGKLRFEPCLPADWDSFKVHYRHRDTVYHITVVQVQSVDTGSAVIIDGTARADATVPLHDDRLEHLVEIRVPRVPT